ncbi:Cyclic nucleotide-binding domain-containing protein 2 [Entophlyctis sp. JEL0112]|nr:Cyclic nucleotide-binding domain-containing protein 2 [Entophlyctis sp. JEL0112]
MNDGTKAVPLRKHIAPNIQSYSKWVGTSSSTVDAFQESEPNPRGADDMMFASSERASNVRRRSLKFADVSFAQNHSTLWDSGRTQKRRSFDIPQKISKQISADRSISVILADKNSDTHSSLKKLFPVVRQTTEKLKSASGLSESASQHDVQSQVSHFPNQSLSKLENQRGIGSEQNIAATNLKGKSNIGQYQLSKTSLMINMKTVGVASGTRINFDSVNQQIAGLRSQQASATNVTWYEQAQAIPSAVQQKHIKTVKCLKLGAIVAARNLAKRSVARLQARKRWRWAINKILRLVKTTNAISAGAAKNFKNSHEDLDIIDQPSRNRAANGQHELGFKLDNFKFVNKSGGSAKVMAALIKAPENRLDEDLRVLEIMFRGLPGFSKYNSTIRKALGTVVRYSRFGPSRTIIKQGQFAQNFYYIMSGELEVWKYSDGKNNWVGTMGSGMIFGELALLLENERRMATVISVTEIELLWLTRDDFEEVLKKETVKELEERKKLIGQHPLFRVLSHEAINNLAMTSKTIELQPDTFIIAEGDKPNSVCLICEGTCKLLKCVYFSKVILQSHPVVKHKLFPFPLPKNVVVPFGPYQKIQKLLKVAELIDGEYFGAASSIANVGTPIQIATLGSLIDIERTVKSSYSVVTSTNVKYIAMNKHTFSKELVHYPEVVKEIAITWKLQTTVFEDSLKTQTLFLEKQEWEKYKTEVMKDLLLKKQASQLQFRGHYGERNSHNF